MTWTHRERLLAALNHEEPDRVPIDFGGAEFTSIVLPAYEKLKEYMGVTEPTKVMSLVHSVAHPAEEILLRFGVDTRIVLPGVYEGGLQRKINENEIIDIFGVHWKRSVGTDDRHFLHIDGPFYKEMTVDMVENFEWPDPRNPGLAKGVKERVEEIKRTGEDYAVCLYLPGGVVHRGYAMRGFESYLKDIHKNREALSHLIDKLLDFWVGTAETVIEAAGGENIDVIYFGEDLSMQNGPMFDPGTVYPELLKPAHRKMVETVKSLTGGAKVCFHCCGAAYYFVEHLIDIGIDALNPVQVTAKNMEPERLKEEFGDRMCFWGGINTQRILPFATPEEVAAETHRVIDILGKGGGYILNSVHNIQPEVPPENVVAMFEAGLNHPYRKAA